MALRRALIACCLLTLTLACGGGSLDDDLAALEASYHSGDYAAVVAETPKLLERAAAESAPGSKVWKAEKLRLQALARQGDAKAAVEGLDRLATSQPERVDATLYVMVSDYVKSAPGVDKAVVKSVDVIHAGIERYPEHKDKFDALIESIKASGDSEALSALAQLGYL